MSGNRHDVETVYHIAAAGDWPPAGAAATYAGGPVCRRDGFIHFSTRDQLPATLARFFAGRDDLVLLAADTRRLGAALRWEAMGEGVFPHYYGTLPVALVRDLGPLRLGADGRHLLPHLPSATEATR